MERNSIQNKIVATLFCGIGFTLCMGCNSEKENITEARLSASTKTRSSVDSTLTPLDDGNDASILLGCSC